MVGEAPRSASYCGNYIYVRISVVASGERDLMTIGRENRARRGTIPRGETQSYSAGARNAPQVSRILEYDLGRVDSRVMQKLRRMFIRQTNARQHQREQSGRPSEHAHYHLILSGTVYFNILRKELVPMRASIHSKQVFCGSNRADTREAASIFRVARAKGVTLTTIDALIGAIAVEHGASVFTLNKNFSRIARITGLVVHPLPRP